MDVLSAGSAIPVADQRWKRLVQRQLLKFVRSAYVRELKHASHTRGVVLAIVRPET